MIGYYIHHHGRGHLSRARCVAAASDEPVVALSALPEPAAHPFAEWIPLPPDPALPFAVDPSAGGALHWAPLDASDYRDRMAVLAGWVIDRRPRVLVVDVSVEVTVLSRLLATPVVVVAGPGDRHDDAHLLGYRAASAVLAPWPDLGERPLPLDRFASKTTFTGAFSRFDDRLASPPTGRGRVLVLHGSGGGSADPDEVAAAAASTPGFAWSTIGGSGRWTDDVWNELLTADVVVTHAGLGALSEVAAARRPAVVLPQDRPFGEQRDTGRRLAAAGLAEVCDRWPTPDAWPELLAAATARGGEVWSRWNDNAGAARFVAALADVHTIRRVA